MSLTDQAWFDFIILVFIAANCITLAMERPNIPPWSQERRLLDIMNNVFTVVFTIEMGLKVLIDYLKAATVVYYDRFYYRLCPPG